MEGRGSIRAAAAHLAVLSEEEEEGEYKDLMEWAPLSNINKGWSCSILPEKSSSSSSILSPNRTWTRRN